MDPSLTESEVNPLSEQSRDLVAATPVARIEHAEDLLTRMLEHQTARIPSQAFLFAAFCAMAFAVVAEVTHRDRSSRFVGMWVGPLLTMGVYNKIVKTFGAR
jgi:hypothetical protein